MSTDNASFTIRNRTVEIKWVSQYCDHILDNYIDKGKSHGVRFQQIAKMLKTCKHFEPMGGRIWCGRNEIDSIKYQVIFILTPKFAVVKTCYRYGYKDN